MLLIAYLYRFIHCYVLFFLSHRICIKCAYNNHIISSVYKTVCDWIGIIFNVFRKGNRDLFVDNEQRFSTAQNKDIGLDYSKSRGAYMASLALREHKVVKPNNWLENFDTFLFFQTVCSVYLKCMPFFICKMHKDWSFDCPNFFILYDVMAIYFKQILCNLMFIFAKMTSAKWRPQLLFMQINSANRLFNKDCKKRKESIF